MIIRKATLWIPECLLAIFALFFYVRELGTFPAPWADDSLFMIVAREYALGNGYSLPLLGYPWIHPYVLGVGPTLIYPVAVAMKVWGTSVAVARIPMVLYLCATTACLYLLTKKISGRPYALIATALLISLSAFTNTGKVVMGEVPGLFFLLVALLLMSDKIMPHWRSILCGLFLGLAIVTKLAYALALAGISIAWIISLVQKKYSETFSMTLIGVAALLTFAAFTPWLGMMQKEFYVELSMFTIGTGETMLPKHILFTQPEVLLRLPFFAYATMFLLGTIGFLATVRKMPGVLSITIITTISLLTIYFLNRSGWYRHLLPAHVLLLLFVPLGARRFFGQKISLVFLSLVFIAQTYWQLEYKGSSRSTIASEAAAFIEQNYPETALIIQQAEVFVQLPRKPHWYFLTNPIMSSRLPKGLVTLTPAQNCMLLLRKFNEGEQQEFFGRLIPVAGGYFLIEPDC